MRQRKLGVFVIRHERVFKISDKHILDFSVPEFLHNDNGLVLFKRSPRFILFALKESSQGSTLTPRAASSAMAKLSQHMSPILTDDVLESLSRRKIFTVIDVLQEAPSKLCSVSGLTFKDVISLRNNLTSSCCPFPRGGLEVYSDFLSNSAITPSGIKSLDDLLEGGFSTGSLVEICGVSAAGKTHLCLAITINAARNLKQQVYWIDTKSDFSARHVHQMLELTHCSDEEIGTIMEAIRVVNVNDFFELYSALHKLQENFSSPHANLRIIIIDSIPTIFYSFMGEQKVDSLGLMNGLVSLMKYIANEFHLTFILVNMTYRRLNEDVINISNNEEHETSTSIINSTNTVEMNVALGKYWFHVPNTRLHLEEVSDKNRKITVLKSTDLPQGKSCIISPADMIFVGAS